MTSEDRRPIAVRGLEVVGVVSDKLVALGVTANSISIFGLVAGFFAGIFLALTSLVNHSRLFYSLLFIGAAILIVLRLLANMLDGTVADRQLHKSPYGELYNEIPDRLTDAAVLIGLGYASGGNEILGFFAALTALLTAYIRAQGKVLAGYQDFSGPMAKQQRMFLVIATCIWLAFAPQRLASVCGYGLPTAILTLVIVGAIFTSGRRLNNIASSLIK